MEQIYGIHAIAALLDKNPSKIKQLSYSLEANNLRIKELVAKARTLKITVAPRPKIELDKLTQNAAHQNIMAQILPAQILPESYLQEIIELANKPPLLLALDGVTDPHNLGACLRSCAAFGVNALIIPKDKSATLNATVRKVACGAAELVPLIAVTNLVRCLNNLRQKGLWIYGAAGEAQTAIYQQDLTSPLVLVMGAEGKGLRRLTRENCDFLIKIPMQNIASLNVSVATGICLAETMRQRQASS